MSNDNTVTSTSQITHIPSRDEVRQSSDDTVRAWHNEYMRRWKIANRDKVLSYNREYNKRRKKTITPQSNSNDNTVNNDDGVTLPPINPIYDNNQKEVTEQ